MTINLRGNLTAQILVAMLMGIVLGAILNLGFSDSEYVKNTIVGGWLYAPGTMFMKLLKMMVVPLVFFGLVVGVAGIGDINKMGRMGGKAFALYLFTTCVAITLGITFASIIGVGEGAEIGSGKYEGQESQSLAEIFISMIPSNPIDSMAKGDMLAVIVFTLIFGFGIALAREKGKPVLTFMEAGNEVVLKMVAIIMKAAPYGIFCLIAKIVAESGLDVIWKLKDYFFLMIFVLLLHAFGTYSVLLTLIARVNPLTFFTKVRSVQMFAFSTASSAATIPVTLRAVQKRLGVSPLISNFTVPLGATLNMDGTAIMQGVATVFVANAYGIDLSLGDFLTVIGTATIASIGTAGVRGAGTIMLAMVFNQVGLPVDGIMLIMAVDPILDMVRTAVNVTGDATVSTAVAKSEGEFDQETFNDLSAGLVDDEDTDLHHLSR